MSQLDPFFSVSPRFLRGLKMKADNLDCSDAYVYALGNDLGCVKSALPRQHQTGPGQAVREQLQFLVERSHGRRDSGSRCLSFNLGTMPLKITRKQDHAKESVLDQPKSQENGGRPNEHTPVA